MHYSRETNTMFKKIPLEMGIMRLALYLTILINKKRKLRARIIWFTDLSYRCTWSVRTVPLTHRQNYQNTKSWINLPKHITEVRNGRQNSKKPLKLHIAKVIAASRKFYRQRSLKEDFLGNVPFCMKIYRHENTRPISRSEMEGH